MKPLFICALICTQLTISFAQPRFGLNLEMGVPTGEFRNNTKAEGFGFGLNFVMPMEPERRVSLGAEFSYQIYGKHIFGIDGESLSLIVNNNMILMHGLARIRPIQGDGVVPIFEVLYGFKYLYTRSKIKDDLFGEPIEANTDFKDTALSYGGAAGLQIPIGDHVDLELKATYLIGGKAEYLDARVIENNGDGTFNFNSKRSETDMIVFKIAVSGSLN